MCSAQGTVQKILKEDEKQQQHVIRVSLTKRRLQTHTFMKKIVIKMNTFTTVLSNQHSDNNKKQITTFDEFPYLFLFFFLFFPFLSFFFPFFYYYIFFSFLIVSFLSFLFFSFSLTFFRMI